MLNIRNQFTSFLVIVMPFIGCGAESASSENKSGLGGSDSNTEGTNDIMVDNETPATGGNDGASGGAGSGGDTISSGGSGTGGNSTGGGGTGGQTIDQGDVQHCDRETNCWEFVKHRKSCLSANEKNCLSLGGKVYAIGKCPDKFSVVFAEDNTTCGLTITRSLP